MRTTVHFRNFALALAGFAALSPLLLAAFVIAVDPYYVFGAPSWRGFNAVRPYYEPHALVAKPYQVRRLRPMAVALGSSRVEVGIDPRHRGWIDHNVFNFALPGGNSYTNMLAFLHAQKIGAPLKQAAIGLDFFGYNIHRALGSQFTEQRFVGLIGQELDTFLDEIRSDREHHHSAAGGDSPSAVVAPSWNEALYLAVNGDVAAAIARGAFKSGREHYELAGRVEGRQGAAVPADWDESDYLQLNLDVAQAVAEGTFVSGYHHYLAGGRLERRLGGFRPKNWNEAGYLAANPDLPIGLGMYRSGYFHYAAIGKHQRRLGGFPAATTMEKLRVRWPTLNQGLFQIDELFRMVFSATAMRDAIMTVLRQDEPADFDGTGMRVWHGREDVMRKLGGIGPTVRKMLTTTSWPPWILPPKFSYCFTDPDTGMDMFDPFRFMLRQAYASGTDVQLYVTPLHAAVRRLLNEIGLGNRYEFWLKELVLINEKEAARAKRPAYPLWDFSLPNTITREPIPLPGDLTPMRWYWDYSHYRKETGDLILDRIFGYTDRSRHLPEDFGVRLTGENIDAHLARDRVLLADWAAANPEFASQIVAAVRNPKSRSRQAEVTCW